MTVKNIFSSLLLTVFSLLFAQQDTIQLTSDVVVDAYRKPSRYINSTKSVMVAGSFLNQQNAPGRLLEGINMLPGARMEERSPGSYRLSVRGSTLRSPFGVRNIKVYLDDFILTDATGNTYLNIIDPELIGRTEIYKGPESGDFGAVTGGTALLKTSMSARNEVAVSAGSYGLFREHISLTKKTDEHFLQFFQSFQQSDGYRNQSGLKRGSFFLKDVWNYKTDHQLNLMLLYTDMHYETPGGITLEQMQQIPRLPRQATATLPGASEQQTGIYNKTVLGGISHQFNLSSELSHFALVQGAYTDLRNPFITNYEKRFEHNFALRTHLNFNKELQNWSLHSRAGFEGGLHKSTIRNFDNNLGNPGNPQNFDNISTASGFFFISQKVDFKSKLFLDASLGLNMMKYDWESIRPEALSGEKNFGQTWLPNVGLTWLLGDGFSLRGKAGKGNSAPTSEEIRSSTQQINTNLAPEFGWNYEVGLRKQFRNYLFVEGSYFDFRLHNAIVRRQNEGGQEYFVNAGGTVQNGFEVAAETGQLRINSILNQIKLYMSGSFYDFKFEDYIQGTDDFSGNELTGVPSTTLQGMLQLQFFNRLDANLSGFYTTSFYLNDANTVLSDPATVFHLMMNYPLRIKENTLNLHLQIQNLFNEAHVLGYDINAFGNRFYNPSALRNFNVGMTFQF